MIIAKEDAIVAGISLAVGVAAVGAAMYFEGKARGLRSTGAIQAMAAGVRATAEAEAAAKKPAKKTRR